MRDHAVLKKRLVEIGDVVDDDFAAGGGEREDAVGKVLLAVESSIEGEIGAWRDVVDDLHHRAALVGAARGQVLDHVDVGRRRQRAIRFVGGGAAKVIEAVGQHADPDAGAVDVQSAFVDGLLHLCRGGASRADRGIGDRGVEQARWRVG